VNKRDLESFRRKLEKEKDRIRQTIQDLDQNTISSPMRESSGDLSAYADHMADAGSDTQEMEKMLDLRNRAERMLEQIEGALERIEEGTYGICVRCEDKISRNRLRAKPFASLCIDCREEIESRRR
jgi:RNA polymerase-binding protein DksA